jgi:hypothetical protein
VAFSVEVSVRFPGEANESGQHVVRNFVAREAGGHEKPANISEGRCSCSFYLENEFRSAHFWQSTSTIIVRLALSWVLNFTLLSEYLRQSDTTTLVTEIRYHICCIYV